jgi:hypothetical protein
MTNQEIMESYQRDDYVVVTDLIDDHELDPMRNFIQARVDEYARKQYAQCKLYSLYEDDTFERRYAAIFEEQEALCPVAGISAHPVANYTISIAIQASLIFSVFYWAMKWQISAAQT